FTAASDFRPLRVLSTPFVRDVLPDDIGGSMKPLNAALAAAAAVALAATPLVPLPAAAQAASRASLSAEDTALVQRAAAYLQGLGSAVGDFIQTDARGRTTRGKFYLQRPGKARFEYAKPSGLLIVSDGHNVN